MKVEVLYKIRNVKKLKKLSYKINMKKLKKKFQKSYKVPNTYEIQLKQLIVIFIKNNCKRKI